MIIGIGTDLCDIRRVEKTLKRFGARFTHRIFTEAERARAERRPNPAARYAQHYAAKEACSKALGTGFRDGVFWRDIRVDNLPSGQPMLSLAGGAQKRLEALMPAGMIPAIHLTLTDEASLAQAVVIIEACPMEVSAP